MPISNLPDRELAKMTAQQIADLALAADQESRRQRKLGNTADAAAWDLEADRLALIFRTH